MPKIAKQSNLPSTKQLPDLVGVLARLGPIKDNPAVKLSVYGRGKTGKTRLACSFPKPLMLIGTEEGTKSVDASGIDFVKIADTSDLDALLKQAESGGSCWKGKSTGTAFVYNQVELGQGDPYKTVVLDTAGGLQDLVTKDVLGLSEIPMQKSWGMAQQQDWGIIGAQTKERLYQILRLSETKQMNVVVIAHERNFTRDDVPADIMLPAIGSALTPTAAGWLNGACDYICQCYIREEEITKTEKLGDSGDGEGLELTRKTGKKLFCLRVGPHPVYMTGFRLPPGFELPDHIIDPSYKKILQIIKGKK
jgi:hypothetical protein